MASENGQSNFLRKYFVLTYFAVLLNSISYLRAVHFPGPLTIAFATTTCLAYCLLYVGPLFLILWLLQGLLNRGPSRQMLSRIKLTPNSATYLVAILGTSLLQVLLFADAFIYRIYGFHINGFVWNLVTTRGGSESLGNSPATTRSFVLIIIGIVVLQTLLLAFSVALSRKPRPAARSPSRRRLIATSLAVLGLIAFTQLTFGVSNAYNYTPVLAASNAFPLFVPSTFDHIAERFGVEINHDPSFAVKVNASEQIPDREPTLRAIYVKAWQSAR